MLRVVQSSSPKLPVPSPHLWLIAGLLVEIAEKPESVDAMAAKMRDFVDRHGSLAHIINVRPGVDRATILQNVDAMNEAANWLEAAAPILRVMVEAKVNARPRR